jgi:uncharacterized protein (DUF1697 family)
MPVYAVFLRAINVTGRFVKMEDLRRILTAAGLQNVQTFIQSGNLWLESPISQPNAVETQIENILFDTLGFEAAAFVRSGDELSQAVQHTPFPGSHPPDASTRYISFLKEAPHRERQEKLLAYATEVDRLAIAGRHVYWLRRSDLGESKFSNAVVERALGAPATMRSITTLHKFLIRRASL